jgi:anthranilate synthase component 2
VFGHRGITFAPMRILLLDNYDSFTWNLHHLLEPWAEVTVRRNDAITVEEAASFDRIVLSPGPGLPAEAGIMPRVVRELMPSHPMLGVCLGLQAMVEACGGRLMNLHRVRHGTEVDCVPTMPLDPLFARLERPFRVGLYHSWAADPAQLPEELHIIARSSEGVIMALRHRRFPSCAVQFHPESVMTDAGPRIIRNWLNP